MPNPIRDKDMRTRIERMAPGSEYLEFDEKNDEHFVELLEKFCVTVERHPKLMRNLWIRGLLGLEIQLRPGDILVLEPNADPENQFDALGVVRQGNGHIWVERKTNAVQEKVPQSSLV